MKMCPHKSYASVLDFHQGTSSHVKAVCISSQVPSWWQGQFGIFSVVIKNILDTTLKANSRLIHWGYPLFFHN